ncbi:MAG: pyruvate kinase [Adhaeribacter sp.]
MDINKLQIEKLLQQLDQLLQDAWELENRFSDQVESSHANYRNSTRNLLHYLALRHRDIRQLQEQLALLGLSSLGRSESHVLANLQAVRNQLAVWLEEDCDARPAPGPFLRQPSPLSAHTEALLGPATPHRDSRIMVTFSSDLATDYELVRRMMLAGMNCARINCAHDDEAVWAAMIAQVKRAEKELGLTCKVLMDLMGPKLRTGPLQPGPKVLAIHPLRDELGRITAPARVWLGPAGQPPPVPVDVVLPVDAGWLGQLEPGDHISLRDARDRKRTLYLVERQEAGMLAHLFKTAFITTGTTLKSKTETGTSQLSQVGEVPAVEVPILLKEDDLLVLHKEPLPGEPAQYDAQGQVLRPAHISCTLPEIFGRVKAGEPILFDDGEITGQVVEVHKNSLLVRITGSDEKGRRLRSDKGINLPDSNLQLNQLTEKDRKDLAFVVRHADIVNLSFVNHPDMVSELQQELAKLKASHLGIMLKIETKAGFSHLPQLLLAVMRSYPAGIMIARGDLAVECGWQRLAEVQEEILWLCEAAHLPVVWATQVLEKLAKKGRPSRAEITDAAMAQRADCVMLNKGPYVLKAIEMLDDILRRMQEHQYKKNPMLRSLQVSEMNLPAPGPGGE